MEKTDLNLNPIAAFQDWYAEAQTKAQMQDPNAMALATVDASGRPSVRMLLLKEFSEEGFIFYTNYGSRKAQELSNGFAALCFYWDSLGRQVRVDGTVEKVSRETSERYFQTRERGSQLGAWASKQSEPLASRAQLEEAVAEMDRKFAGKEVPLPPHWGGYLLRPTAIEFWQQSASRLHDRFLYLLDEKSRSWSCRRLFP